MKYVRSTQLAVSKTQGAIGVPSGKYQIVASVRGYQAVEKDGGAVELDRDIDNFVLALNRGAGR
jgi:hypothetical protein